MIDGKHGYERAWIMLASMAFSDMDRYDT